MDNFLPGPDAPPYPYLVIRCYPAVHSLRPLPPELSREELVDLAQQTMERLGCRFRMCVVFAPADALYLELDGSVHASTFVPFADLTMSLKDPDPTEPNGLVDSSSTRSLAGNTTSRRDPMSGKSRRARTRAKVVRPMVALVPERRRSTGEIRLTRNHLALLKGLIDRPRATALSRVDFARAGYPHLKRYDEYVVLGNLYHAISRLPSRWVASRRVGNRIEYRLRPRGRAIVEGQVPAIVDGLGPYAPGRK